MKNKTASYLQPQQLEYVLILQNFFIRFSLYCWHKKIHWYLSLFIKEVMSQQITLFPFPHRESEASWGQSD